MTASDSVERYIWPDEGECNGVVLFVARDQIPDPDEAIQRAIIERDDFADAPLVAEPILMREISEVEARIKGYDPDTTFYLPCTDRARRAMPYWRVVVRR